MIWQIRLTLASLSLAVASVSLAAEAVQRADSTTIETHPKWNVPDLPPSLRSRVHLRAKDLPPFPSNASWLEEPERWPATQVVNGVTCSLRVTAGTGSIRYERTFKNVRPGEGFCLYYVGPPWGTWPNWGPMYCWREGRITERDWAIPDSAGGVSVVTAYWPSGEVLQHESRRGGFLTGRLGPSERLEEHFARDGNLLGCAHVTVDAAGKTQAVYYWDGRTVPREEHSRKMIELYRMIDSTRTR